MNVFKKYLKNKILEVLLFLSWVMALWMMNPQAWHEFYLDESILQPQSALYVLDLNPSLEYEYATKPVVRAPDRRFQAFVKHYGETLSDIELLFDILHKFPWDLKTFNRFVRLSGIVSRILIAEKYCNKVYVKKVHPQYSFLQECIWETCAELKLTSQSFQYDNYDSIGTELHLFI